MKIAIVQLQPFPGEIEKNIVLHRQMIEVAAGKGSDLIVFPELSITGYEPTLADTLAMPVDDARLSEFQTVSDTLHVALAIGVPLRVHGGIYISLVIFLPRQQRQVYAKHYLHPDEEPFFVPGDNLKPLSMEGQTISFAICYEISFAEHVVNSLKEGGQVYVASVAKFLQGVDKAVVQLSEIATKHGIPVLMSNAIGASDGGFCAGKSSVWNNRGELLGQLDGAREGMLIFDTDINSCEQWVR